MRKLGRRKEHRKSMLINMAKSLLEYGKINTTTGRAKELRPIIEKLITKSKVDTLANRRLCYSRLQNSKKAVDKLFELGLRYKERPGGYTRIIRSGFRTNSEPTSIIEVI